MPVLGVIPARLGSTRLWRKPLQPLGGVPLVVRVAERVRARGLVDRLVIATDSPEIEGVARHAGFEAVLTSPQHQSGTDRVGEVATRPEFAGFDKILNVQGDEPFVARAALEGALDQLRGGFDLGTAAAPLAPDHRSDPMRVKVTVDPTGRALMFSRTEIPGRTNWLHLGVYAYRRSALEQIARSAPIAEEKAQRLEQLRPLGLGLRIGVALVDQPSGPAVDTAADLAEAEAHWNLLTEVTR